MTDHLMLDAAYPPMPQQWIDDMNAVGADGGFVYVWGPITLYSIDHVVTARANGKAVIPIIVPGNQFPDNGSLLNTLRALGFTSGSVVIDLEPGSEPPDYQVHNFSVFLGQNGYVEDRYGTISVLGTYSPEGEDWIADWIRTGQLSPLPALPAGWNARQFVNDVMINGHTYDASVVSDAFMVGGLDMATIGLDGKDPNVQQLLMRVNDVWHSIVDARRAGIAFAPDGSWQDIPEPDWLDATIGLIKQISQPQVDANALATALVGNTAFVQALASAVAHELGSALDKAP